MPHTMMEKISLVNSVVRTLLAVVLLGGVGVGSWYAYSRFNEKEIEARRAAEALAAATAELAVKDREIGELHVQVADQQEEIQRLDAAMRLLKVDTRVATLSVLDQELDTDQQVLSSLVEFQEVSENGEPLGESKRFTIQGDIVYVDSWVVKFEDKYVEDADLIRGTSLVLFRRLFGEQQSPQDGFVLDREGERPVAYAVSEDLSAFERKIWGDFWNVADDEARQAELGIRAMHAEAPSYRVKQGRKYRITRRASAGLTFEDDGEVSVPARPAA